jgi:hypothetical protein
MRIMSALRWLLIPCMLQVCAVGAPAAQAKPEAAMRDWCQSHYKELYSGIDDDLRHWEPASISLDLMDRWERARMRQPPKDTRVLDGGSRGRGGGGGLGEVRGRGGDLPFMDRWVHGEKGPAVSILAVVVLRPSNPWRWAASSPGVQLPRACCLVMKHCAA